MATSSGNASENIGSEKEMGSLMNERKRKRMQSNRESARRSRARKQKHLDDLMVQMDQLRKENNQILTSINITTEQFMNVEADNSVIRAQMVELSQRLESLNEILKSMNIVNNHNNNNGIFETGEMQTGFDSMMMMMMYDHPWHLMYQPDRDWLGRNMAAVHISTNPASINPYELKKLYGACNHSSHRFPKKNPSSGLVDPMDIDKLRTAISHSSILVSVFARPQPSILGLENIIPVTPQNGILVGFGRAVSDFGLTASIYDVIPYLRRRGIGRMIVQKILRMLTRIEVYDIVALCSDQERPFFKACGFGDDVLGSTSMMYSRTASVYSEDNQVVAAGRKLLWIPPIRENCGISSLSDG